MPTEDEHTQLAIHNMEVVDYLLVKPEFADWTATITFYTALHIVEAVFFHDQKHVHQRHGQNHENREQLLKGTKSYENMYKHYRPLQAASVVARYLQSSRGRVLTFQAYMPSNQVRSKLVKHHLAQLIKTARKFLSPDCARSLDEKSKNAFK